MAQLRHRQDELSALGCRPVVITFGSVQMVRRWLEENAPGLTILRDPDLAAYRAFGLERSWRRVLHPRTFLKYLQLLLQGWRIGKSEGGLDQLGGDFVIDRRGRVRLARPSRHPADRPRWEELAAALGPSEPN